MDLVAKICLGSVVLLEAKSYRTAGGRSATGDETALPVCGCRTGSALIRLRLALALAACSLLDFGLVLAASSGAGPLGRSGFAGCALDLLALDLVGNAGGVCHEVCVCFPEKEV